MVQLLLFRALLRHQAGKGLIPLRTAAGCCGSALDHRVRSLQRLIAAEKFHATLPAKLDKAEADWHATQPTAPDPIIVEHPIDDTLQTGDSRLLGGGMSIHAPWKRDH
jgi:hypothetical protein